MIKCCVCAVEMPKKISYIRRHYLDNGHAGEMSPRGFITYLKDECHWEGYGLGDFSAKED